MDRSISLAVVGAGLIGRRHIDAIQQSPHVELAAIVDREDSARDLASKLSVNFFDSIQELFKHCKVDGAILSTPTPLHVEQGTQCIKALCPVLIEKPISVNSMEALALVHRGEEYGVPVLVGHHRRHNPLIQKARAVIASGEIGDIRGAQGTCWLHKPDDYFEVAPWRKKKGAGPISVNLVHDVDVMRFLLGDVVRVQAAAAESSRGFENEDVASAVLTFADGVIGTLSVSDSIVAPWSWELTARENPAYPVTNQNCLMIGGSKGSLSVPDLTVWTYQGKRSWWEPISATHSPQLFSDPLVNQITHFADVIAGETKPLISAHEGMKTLQVVEAIQQSASRQQTVEIEDLF